MSLNSDLVSGECQAPSCMTLCSFSAPRQHRTAQPARSRRTGESIFSHEHYHVDMGAVWTYTASARGRGSKRAVRAQPTVHTSRCWSLQSNAPRPQGTLLLSSSLSRVPGHVQVHHPKTFMGVKHSSSSAGSTVPMCIFPSWTEEASCVLKRRQTRCVVSTEMEAWYTTQRNVGFSATLATTI